MCFDPEPLELCDVVVSEMFQLKVPVPCDDL